jgi:hypothetical protein
LCGACSRGTSNTVARLAVAAEAAPRRALNGTHLQNDKMVWSLMQKVRSIAA